MQAVDAQLSHVWMVRTFLKHSEEAEEDDELREIVRVLYDFCLAVGPALAANDPAEYLKIIRKKLGKVRDAAAHYREILPQVSAHTNFQMAGRSLDAALTAIGALTEANSAGG